MGNEQSQLTGVEIEEKAVEVSDFWSQHAAYICTVENVTNLSVFVGEVFVNGPLWTTQTPLEKISKNFKIYRHPCIVKYISSWSKNSKFYLAVEEIKPLTHILPTLNTLEICIGLHSILKALCFLHDTAGVSHNNICTASIYVSKDGCWKLGGMEYLCRFGDLNCDYLSKSRNHRYNKAVDPNEDKHIVKHPDRKDFIDVFAFGVLVCEVLKSKKNEEISTLSSFREQCESVLQNIDVTLRPKLHSLLDHDFFNHEFIAIHSFLIELPLKSDEDKTEFFSTLTEKLKLFDESIVGNQLGNLLLSRMVLLNKTAQTNLLPAILSSRQGADVSSNGIFSEETFKKCMSPKLLEIFGVRDAQIRLLLLNHFPYFVQTFTKEQLQTCILPELLVGIKDTSDHLVSVTLRTLADLVPILGATTVIGGKRAKLFNDGRPMMQQPQRKHSRALKLQHESLPQINDQISLNSFSNNDLPNQLNGLPERPRPDGEEGDTSTEDIDQSIAGDGDLDNWEDWDVNEHNASQVEAAISEQLLNDNTNQYNIQISLNDNVEETSAVLSNLVTLPDITELDIKNQLNETRRRSSNNEEIDFFQDMEPVIESTNKFVIDEDRNVNSSKFNLNASGESHEEGWDDGDWD